MAKERKTGGRQRGSWNKTKFDVDAFIAKEEAASGRKLADIVASILLDRKTRAAIALRLMEYRFGRPRESVEVSGGISNYVQILQEARARVAKVYEQEAAKLKTAEPVPAPANRPLLTSAIGAEIVPPEQAGDRKADQELRVKLDGELPITLRKLQ